jgi:capsular polysaccharide biosynthesis protein
MKLLARVRQPFQQPALDLLDVARDWVVDVGDDQTVFCPLMFFPAPLVVRGNFWRRPPQIMPFFDAMRERAAGADPKAGPLIYIGREDAPVRRLVNEDEVVRALAPLGFEKVLLTKLALAEQIALFARARAIVAPHGAGLANMAFCRPGTSVIEIVSPDRLWPTYRAIAARRGLDYGFVLGDQSDPALRNGDFRLDTRKLTALLSEKPVARAA